MFPGKVQHAILSLLSQAEAEANAENIPVDDAVNSALYSMDIESGAYVSVSRSESEQKKTLDARIWAGEVCWKWIFHREQRAHTGGWPTRLAPHRAGPCSLAHCAQLWKCVRDHTEG